MDCASVIFAIKMANKKSYFEAAVFLMGACPPPRAPLPQEDDTYSCMVSQLMAMLSKISLLASKST